VPGVAAEPRTARVVPPPPSPSPLFIAGTTLLVTGGVSALVGFDAIYFDHDNLSEKAMWAMGSMMVGGTLLGVVGYVMVLKDEGKIASGPRLPMAVAPLVAKNAGGASMRMRF
jgi:hypothetical protein